MSNIGVITGNVYFDVSFGYKHLRLKQTFSFTIILVPKLKQRFCLDGFFPAHREHSCPEKKAMPNTTDVTFASPALDIPT